MAVLIANANALTIPLADQSVHCIVTSPPYWGLRDYGVDGQLGNERTPEEFIANMVTVFRECWRVLRDDGTLWLNLGDSYAGSWGNYVAPNSASAKALDKRRKDRYGTYKPPSADVPSGLKPKDLVGIPWRVALALQADGWYLRSDIIWHKPNPMPESVTDRPTKAHEYVFLLTKSPRYFYDAEAVKEQVTPSTVARLSQDVENQTGSTRANGGAKTNGTMKAVGKAYSFARNVAEADRPGQAASNHRADREDVQYVGSRNRRSVWTIATAPYSGAHFATYPPDLVEPCIKAGTSARGVCPECGAPWEREVEHAIMPTAKAAKTFVIDERDLQADEMDQGSNRQKDGHKPGYISANKTIGWRPTCDCGREDAVPAIVFDPFAGSGTTLMVARALGRHGVGLDLSMTYIRECAKERLGFEALSAWTNGRKAEGNHADLPLFTTLENLA